MKPAVPGRPASASIAIVSGQASAGPLAAEALDRADVVAETGLALADRDHGERGEVHQRVRRQVEEKRLTPASFAATIPTSM